MWLKRVRICLTNSLLSPPHCKMASMPVTTTLQPKGMPQDETAHLRRRIEQLEVRPLLVLCEEWWWLQRSRGAGCWS